MDDDLLKGRLATLFTKTKSASKLDPSGWWVGDQAGERQVRDDLRAGRVQWAAAHRNAKRGLTVLRAGDRELAETRGLSCPRL